MAGLLFLLAGCHGGAQSDVVERELRWQEDQIYAMEDYLSEYQQLLCQYRAENSALKRQIASGRQNPRQRTQIRRDQEKIEDTDEIIQEVLPTEVPSLMDTMPAPPGASQQPRFGPDLEFRPARRHTPGVRRTALEQRRAQPAERTMEQFDEPQLAAEPLALDEAFAEDAAPEAIQNASEETPSGPEPLENAVVHGDVLPGNGEHGPRLLVEVEPLGASGGVAEFAGNLSLMVLDASGDKPRGVARWDFSPAQLAELLGEDPGAMMEFPLQLPDDTPTDQPLQLWARLVPADGAKVLAHVDVDLTQLGPFSSVRPQPVVLQPEAVAEPVAEQVADEEPDAPIEQEETENPAVNLSVGDWDGWQVARPDQVKRTPPSRPEPEAQWRKATQPIPTSVNHGRPVMASAEAKPGDRPRTARRTERPKIEPPTWSPDRTGHEAAASDQLVPPEWSPER